METSLKELVKLTESDVGEICQNDLYDTINRILIDYIKQYTCVRRLNMAVCDISDFMLNETARIGINMGKNYFNGEFVSVGSHGEGLGLLSNDRDTICINNQCTAVVTDLYTEPTEDDLVVETDNCYPGYCRLKFHRLNQRNIDTFGNEVKKIGREWYLKTSCLKNRFKHGNELYDSWESHGPALSDDTVGQDFVLAIKCRNPGPLIKHYFSRERYWPGTDALLHLEENVPFTIVTSFHHRSVDPTVEFRLSYAQAERFLIRTLDENQFAVYVFLKQIKPSLEKRVSNKDIIRSYYIKTVLLWACESIPNSQWHERYFIRSSLWCLKILSLCYKTGTLPSLFVPQNNLLDQYDKTDLMEAYSVINSFTNEKVFLKNILGSFCDDRYEHFEHIFLKMKTRSSEGLLRAIFKEHSVSSFPLDRIRWMIECETVSHIVIEKTLIDPEVQVPVILEVIENIHTFLSGYPIEYQCCIRTLLKRYIGDYLHTVSKSLRTYHSKCLQLFQESKELCLPVSMTNDHSVSGTIHVSLFQYLNGDNREACDTIFSAEQNILSADILSDLFYAADFTTKGRLATDSFLLGLFPKPSNHELEVYFALKIKYLAIAMYIISNCHAIAGRQKVVLFKKKTSTYISCLRDARVDVLYPETMHVLYRALCNFIGFKL